ncbi:hypothetical protein [Pseudarthrobacter sp. BRE9]|uniref:hypothetical protein n=1 Tax=Pseudarthrobacter sp. BRE9 TaxID=2962582 RepID=UPI0028817DE9|nr:hypothetical protein [Pseudarthrobacter sp. BRE9]MDT0169334.1 hypothetical protein [Pseudarthrobacter sp. BRE9]
MSKTSVSRSTRAKVALVPVVSMGLFGASVAMAAPAQAETSGYGCTVDPLDPKDLHGDDADFSFKVDCNGEKTVEIRQRIYEDERGSHHNDDLIVKRLVTVEFDHHDDARTIHYCVDVGNHDRDVYQLVSFRVEHGGHWSDWTDWEKSAVVEVDNDWR